MKEKNIIAGIALLLLMVLGLSAALTRSNSANEPQPKTISSTEVGK